MIRSANPTGTYYYHFDVLGSVIALSNTSGNIVERYSYDVFGEPNRVSSVGNPYMFTGREYDPCTGLYYYRARYYKPLIGRFLQTDPLRKWSELNLYTYVKNNPINMTDPSGQKCCKWVLDSSSSKKRYTICILVVWPCLESCPYMCYGVYDLARWKCVDKEGKVIDVHEVPGDWVYEGTHFIEIPFGRFAPIVIKDPVQIPPPPGMVIA
jgi:RHS repeat-associated protein